MSELRSGPVNPSAVPTPREMSSALDDIIGQAELASAVKLDLLLHKYDYRQLAHSFAEQLRREGPHPAVRRPARHGLDKAS